MCALANGGERKERVRAGGCVDDQVARAKALGSAAVSPGSQT
jgi:hypothetical protein